MWYQCFVCVRITFGQKWISHVEGPYNLHATLLQCLVSIYPLDCPNRLSHYGRRQEKLAMHCTMSNTVHMDHKFHIIEQSLSLTLCIVSHRISSFSVLIAITTQEWSLAESGGYYFSSYLPQYLQ